MLKQKKTIILHTVCTDNIAHLLSLFCAILLVLLLAGCHSQSLDLTANESLQPDLRPLNQQRLAAISTAAKHNTLRHKAIIKRCPDFYQAKKPTLMLASALDIALCRNPQTQVSWAKIKEYESRIDLSKSAFKPNVTLNYQVANTLNSQLGETSHPIQHQLSLSAEWLLYDFGDRKAKLQQAIAEYQAVNADFYKDLQSIIYDVSQKYERIRYMQALIQLRQKNETIARKSLAIAKQYYTVGFGLKSDVYQAKTAVAEAQLARLEAQNEYRKSKGLFIKSLGLSISGNEPLKLKPQQTPVLANSMKHLKKLIKTAKLKHPEILAQLARVNAAESTLTAVSTENKPRVSVFNTVSGYQRLEDDFDTSSNVIVGLRLSVPLYDGQAQSARRTIQQFVVAQQTAQLQLLENNILQQVEDSYYQMQSAVAQYETAKEIKHNAQLSYEAAIGRYQHGIVAFSEVLDAQRQIQNAGESMIKTQYDWYQAQLALRAGIGELVHFDNDKRLPIGTP